MATIWLYFVYTLLPLPLISLILLSIPLPSAVKSPIRKFILKVLDSIIFFQISSFFTVYSAAVTLSILLFVQCGHQVHLETKNTLLGAHGQGHHHDLGRKWRAERNFWISAFSLALWIILFRVRALIKEVQNSNKSD